MMPLKRRQIEAKARDVGVNLVNQLVTDSRLVIEKLRASGLKIEDAMAAQFEIEMFVFLLHLLDRASFGVYGEDGREIFQNELIWGIRADICDVFSHGGPSEAGFAYVMETYNERQPEYATFKKELPEKDQSLKGTLWWEFTKKMASGLIGQSGSSDEFAKNLSQLSSLIMDGNGIWRLYRRSLEMLR